ncbi:MAG: hypothetical protein EOO15_09665 [Chitinophagaceae bacterium]|nr:MAG: hypothetical protein EOO15_09665 [Chitinophagaceae bacterium]
MSNELVQLQTENRRLSALVAALAEKNLRLEEELNRSKQDTFHPASSVSRYPDPGVDLSSAQGGMLDGSLNLFRESEVLAFPEFNAFPTRERTNHADANHSSGGGGLTTALLTPHEAGESLLPDGLKLPDPFRKQVERAAAEARRQARVALLAGALPGWQAIATALRTGPMPKLRWPQERNLPLLLCCLCRPDEQRLSYPEMQKSTGLSYTGLYKLLQAGCRAGLIVRAGWQRYQLTELALSVLEQAAAGKSSK